jgi:hypothetical protein
VTSCKSERTLIPAWGGGGRLLLCIGGRCPATYCTYVHVRELLRPSGFCGLYWQTVDSLIAIPCSCGTNDNYAARELVQGARRKEDGRLRENKGQKVRAMRSQRDRVL